MSMSLIVSIAVNEAIRHLILRKIMPLWGDEIEVCQQSTLICYCINIYFSLDSGWAAWHGKWPWCYTDVIFCHICILCCASSWQWFVSLYGLCPISLTQGMYTVQLLSIKLSFNYWIQVRKIASSTHRQNWAVIFLQVYCRVGTWGHGRRAEDSQSNEISILFICLRPAELRGLPAW